MGNAWLEGELLEGGDQIQLQVLFLFLVRFSFLSWWQRQKGAAHVKGKLSFRYKFCIAIENSLAMDYVTEKVYDALAAGCVPIYYGAPNIRCAAQQW